MTDLRPRPLHRRVEGPAVMTRRHYAFDIALAFLAGLYVGAVLFG